MIYRPLGKTGMSVSIVGLGGEYLEGQDTDAVRQVMDRAIDAGVNILDIFMSEPNVRSNIGAALKGRRDKMFLQGQICSAWVEGQYTKTRDLAVCKESLEDLFVRLGTDYIDIGMIHYCDTEEDMKLLEDNGIIDYCLEMKKSGRFRSLGIGCHNSTIAKKLVETDLFDVLMFSINPAMDMIYNHYSIDGFMEKVDGLKDGGEAPAQLDVDQERAELYTLCEKKGVGITVMKVYGGGRLLSADTSPFRQAMTTSQCIQYALSRPGVASALVGVKSVTELEEALKYLKANDEEKDYSWIFNHIESYSGNACVYCSHCQPCPVEINIAAVTRLLDQARISGITPEIRQAYDALAVKASACISCGACNTRCPFGIDAMENMRQTGVLLG
ncbi:MAG: aldo/keto reductase [Eubacteriales bacterium]|jgi:predicted aldo/keto reductase-like oxidoreductase|nr:aldo/keto reductase [Eubacteriales bacterium]MDD3289945.1 aldo/keto reductase [Eubacteriales bacterium]MDD3863894.1 aldo/keto reductase [Eubacteriales bacterium]